MHMVVIIEKLIDVSAEQGHSGLLITPLKEGKHCQSHSCSVKSLFCEKGFHKNHAPQYKMA